MPNRDELGEAYAQAFGELGKLTAHVQARFPLGMRKVALSKPELRKKITDGYVPPGVQTATELEGLLQGLGHVPSPDPIRDAMNRPGETN